MQTTIAQADAAEPTYLPEDRNAQVLFLQNGGDDDLAFLPGRRPELSVNDVEPDYDGTILPANAAAPLILHGALARCAWSFRSTSTTTDGKLRWWRSDLGDAHDIR